jgi:hypothetical protein
MLEMSSDRNLDGLMRVARERTVDAEEAATKAILALQKRGVPVNFATVAAEAGCSRTYLYSHPELRERIQKARSARVGASSTPAAAARSESSKDRIIEALRSKVERLESDLTAARKDAKQLRTALERALGDAQYWKEQAKRAAHGAR